MNPGYDGVDFTIRKFRQTVRHGYKARSMGYIAHYIALVDIDLNIVIAFQGDPSAAGVAAGAMTGIAILLQDRYDSRGILYGSGVTGGIGNQLIFALFGTAREGENQRADEQDHY